MGRGCCDLGSLRYRVGDEVQGRSLLTRGVVQGRWRICLVLAKFLRAVEGES